MGQYLDFQKKLSKTSQYDFKIDYLKNNFVSN